MKKNIPIECLPLAKTRSMKLMDQHIFSIQCYHHHLISTLDLMHLLNLEWESRDSFAKYIPENKLQYLMRHHKKMKEKITSKRSLLNSLSYKEVVVEEDTFAMIEDVPVVTVLMLSLISRSLRILPQVMFRGKKREILPRKDSLFPSSSFHDPCHASSLSLSGPGI